MTSTFHQDLEVLRNRTFDEIAVGESAAIERTLTATDIQLFAAMSGDINPTHIDAEFAASTQYQGVIAHGGGLPSPAAQAGARAAPRQSATPALQT